MKRRNRRRRKARRPRDCSVHKRPTDQNDPRRRQWPELSLEELADNRLGRADKAALAAEYVAVKQLPVGPAYVGDWPTQKCDQNGGD